MTEKIACYDIFELTLDGPSDGNPYLDVGLSACFHYHNLVLEMEGFYDGGGTYRIRFMPVQVGEWSYLTRSNRPELDGLQGTFTCVPSRGGNHGPIRVANGVHLAYANGTRHFSWGTTCYGWVNQPRDLQEQTLQSLAESPFNKVRMCVFPKHYTYNLNEPPFYPFLLVNQKDDQYDFDFTRPQVEFWHNLEKRIAQLGELGIEADIILFHPYDRWGFSNMCADADDRYLRYAIARLGAFHNVWWSLANEYDIMRTKTPEDWERFFRIVQTYDPYRHMCSVHNWIALQDVDTKPFYNFSKPWVTHCSIQHAHVELTDQWRNVYGKPVVIDEACYEGNIPNGWGNLTGEEMTRRFWETMVRGGYCGHGECYLSEDDVLWWSKGGVLKGTSPARIAFLRQVMEDIPSGWIDPVGSITNTHLPAGGQPGKYYLTYFGVRQPAEVTLTMPDDGEYRVDVINTWEMTIIPVETTFRNQVTIKLPGKPYQAVRVVRIG